MTVCLRPLATEPASRPMQSDIIIWKKRKPLYLDFGWVSQRQMHNNVGGQLLKIFIIVVLRMHNAVYYISG